MGNTEKEIRVSETQLKVLQCISMFSVADDLLLELNVTNKLAKNLFRNAKINLGRGNDELMKGFDFHSGDSLNAFMFGLREASEGFLCLNERDRRSVLKTIENKLIKQYNSQENGKSE